MALDPSIVFRQFVPTAQGIQQTQQAQLRTAGIFQNMRNEAAMAPVRQQIAETTAALNNIKLAEAEAQRAEAIKQRDTTNIARNYLINERNIKAGNYGEVVKNLESYVDRERAAGQTDDELSDTLNAIEVFKSNDSNAITSLINTAKGAVDYAKGRGWIGKKGEVVEKFSPTTVNLPGGITVQTSSTGGKKVTDAAGNKLTGQAAIDAIEEAEKQKTQQRIDIARGTTKARLEEQAEGVGAVETSKVKGRVAGEAATAPTVAKIKSQISVAVKNAEREAKSRGEKLSDLSRMEAALPGLKETVNKLRELAPIATHTLGGRLIDTAVKELGFGATKGATARAKYIAIIRNQVLPLLKPTFGAAFTAAEGEKLEATLGDPDLSPDEKLAQLDAFIDNKVREIETTKRDLPTDDLSGLSDDEFKDLLR